MTTSDMQLNSVIANTDNSYNEISQFILNSNKINIKEIEPTTGNINEYISEDLNNVIDELVSLIFKELNKGKNDGLIKQLILNYINNYEIASQEINHYLLNNQNNSNSIYLLGYFSYHGIGSDPNKQKAIELYQKASMLENSVAQLSLVDIYTYGETEHYCLVFELSKKLAEKEYAGGINNLGVCYYYGIGTDIDYSKAFELFQKATDLGFISGW
jgi:TPR repeat protein